MSSVRTQRRRWCAVALSSVLLGTLLPVDAAVANEPARTAAPEAQVALPPEVERLLPPGGRALSGALRVIRSMGSRNRVYREADAVQRDLESYYDQQIETAREQLRERELNRIGASQVGTYVRVIERLKREKQEALAITEREKNDARLQFQGRLVQTISNVLISTPRVRDGMNQLRGAIEDLQGAFRAAAAAADGQNPLDIALQPIRDRLDRYAEVAGAASLVTGDLGRRVNQLISEAQNVIGQYDEAGAEARDAATGIADRLDGLIGEVDTLLEQGRRARGGDDVADAGEALLRALFPPGGEDPSEDAAADAVARQLGLDPDVVRGLGVSTGAIDPATLATMRERVRGEILRRQTERIAAGCGAVVGAARRAAGETVSDTPCDVLADPDRIIEILTADDPDDPEDPAEPDAPGTAPEPGAAAPPAPAVTTTVPPTTTTTTTVPPTTTTTTTTTTTLPPPPPTDPPPPPRPENISTVVGVSEGLVGQARDIATSVTVDVVYGDDGTAAVSFSASSSSSWDQVFPCLFDNDPNQPTGDTSTVRYSFSGAATGSGGAPYAPDGSFSVGLGYEMGGSISGTQTVLFTADCAYLNGSAIPDVGAYGGSGTLTVTVRADGSVGVSTAWSGRFGAVEGSGG